MTNNLPEVEKRLAISSVESSIREGDIIYPGILDLILGWYRHLATNSRYCYFTAWEQTLEYKDNPKMQALRSVAHRRMRGIEKKAHLEPLATDEELEKLLGEERNE